ncbi:Ig-like domain-containing protein [Rhodopseudomonas sp. HC1]|uniref:Ig-like domain-containing protein n=1 Tax=Rhodopseudomonas infernalis TaxID=2897386 RepID=UPI001EE8BDF8|nr:Ig-like domain-containing protein [Rhodopseudomonas infernalis]MCG6204553.1 Ig-like domain-containing protein [Rhodopseudomonas infernalis]
MRMSFWRALIGVAALVLIALPGTALAQYEVLSERTTIGLTVTVDPAVPGRATLRAEVTTPFGAGVPEGRITFHDMTTQQVLGWSGVEQPQIIIDGVSPGRHMLRADYSGTTAYLPLIMLPSQSAQVPLNIRMQPALTLSSSSELVAPGDLVTFSVTVTGHAGVPCGRVTLRDGDEVIAGHLRLDHAGAAAFTTLALPPGPHSIVAVYEGDERYAAATIEIEQQVTSTLAAVAPQL